jgi:hypothetical protein
MEFGDTIPLFFITVCCLGVIPVIGFTLLAVIRFNLKDKQLSKNILITIICTGILSILFPIFEMLWPLTTFNQNCGCKIPFELPPEIVRSQFVYALKGAVLFIYPGIAVGFILAFALTLPITLGVRFFRKRNLSFQSGSLPVSSNQEDKHEK